MIELDYVRGKWKEILWLGFLLGPGVGEILDFLSRLLLYADLGSGWERFFELGDQSVGATTDVDLVTIGVVFRF